MRITFLIGAEIDHFVHYRKETFRDSLSHPAGISFPFRRTAPSPILARL